jgi:hypothetical protein
LLATGAKRTAGLPARAGDGNFSGMSTLSEVKAVVPLLSSEELEELEQLVRKARQEMEQVTKPSLRDLKPASVGKMLRPLGAREEWYDEMLEGKV